jgi:regulator of replication initiation timing
LVSARLNEENKELRQENVQLKSRVSELEARSFEHVNEDEEDELEL